MVVGLGLAVSAQAQVLDLQTGHGANVMDEPKVSVEGGLVAGDADYIGARGNFKLSEPLLLGINLGQTELFDDEIAIGGFAVYQVSSRRYPVAIKAGYDTTLDSDYTLSEFSGLAIVSGAINNQATWYANGGVHYVEFEIDTHINHGPYHASIKEEDDDLVPTLGGGFVFAFTDNASAYAAVDVLMGDVYDDTVIGGGFRWSFR